MTETAFDKWEPQGTPIHPLDLFELINTVGLADFEEISRPPEFIDGPDYIRNKHKIGTVVRVNGKLYFETTTVEPVTKAFA